MPRQRRLRKIVEPPHFKGYRPFGNMGSNNGFIELLYEEYEAIKMADYRLLKHDQAAELMGISRATFARIYETARRKIAKAIVEVKEIRTVYGNAWMNGNWFFCKACNARYNITELSTQPNCPLCKSNKIEPIK